VLNLNCKDTMFQVMTLRLQRIHEFGQDIPVICTDGPLQDIGRPF